MNSNGSTGCFMNRPFISFCIPTYNRSSYLEGTLQSIIDDCRDISYEIVVSDNASSDNTSEIVGNFKRYHNVKYIKNPTNIGSPKNLFQAIESASGHYVWLMGDDDPLSMGICNHLFKMVENRQDLDYILMPRNLVNKDLSRCASGGIQPKGISCDQFFQRGRDLYEACEGQTTHLIGFYGCNCIRKEIWQQSVSELRLHYDNWSHLRVILNAIKDRPCAIAGRVGVLARINPSPEIIDSRVWIDYSVPVYLDAIEWGYSKKLCEDAIQTKFRSHALLFVLDKAMGRRNGNLLTIAMRFNCHGILKWNTIWMLVSFLPRFILIPLLWLRKWRCKFSGKCRPFEWRRSVCGQVIH